MPDHQLSLHSLSDSAYGEICAGVAGAETMAVLVDAEHSRRRLLLRRVLDMATGFRTGPDFERAFDTLAVVEEVAPNVVRDLLLHPPLGVWLRRTVVGHPDHGNYYGYLELLGAAAAIRARTPCVLQIPVSFGSVVLPTVGMLRLPKGFPSGKVKFRYSGDEIAITAEGGHSVRGDMAGAGATFRPTPLHWASSGGRHLTVWIDDTDPYRTFRDPSPADETEPAGLAAWCALLDQAWDLLVRYHPGRAGEVAACLRTVTPVEAGDAFSSAAAIGAIATPGNLSAVHLAETFVHEIQHSKLNAVANMANFAHAGAPGRYYAPWRDDPRPLSGMLHGLFAFVAVAEFWLDQRVDVTAQERYFQLALRRRQVRRALESLADVDGLTAREAELVAGVHARLIVCENEPVPPELDAEAERTIADHHSYWMRQHR